MVSPTTDRRFGLVGNAALKAPVAAVATSNITLSGQQTIDGVALLATNASGVPDRVLLTGQSDATQNGIYDVNLNAWSRSADADGPYDFATGTQVLVGGGTLYVRTVWCLTTASPITLNSSSLTWQLAVGASLGNFLQSGVGARARTFTLKDRDTVSVKDFGAIGDGANHQLSERYTTLVAAQVDFPFVTALTQSIDWAAFQAAHDSFSAAASYVGGTILVPAGSYFLSNTWAITKRITVLGANAGDQSSTAATVLNFPSDTTGIRCYSNIDSSTGTGADYTRLSGLNLVATAKNVSGNGVHSTCTIHVEHCIVRNFKAHGILFNGQTGGGATGIADYSTVTHCRSSGNSGDGVHINGNDSNVCQFLNVQSTLNGGWGFYDNCFYCSTYVGCGCAGNTSGSFYNNNATGAGGLYLGCYVESDAGATLGLDGNALWIGGTASPYTTNAFYPTGTGLGINIPTGGRIGYFRNGVEVGRLESDNTLINFKGATFNTNGSAGGNDFIDMSSGNRAAISVTTTAAHTALFFNNPNGTVGTITTTGSATTYATSSDYRLKDNVQPMHGPDAIARIMALRPVKYTWKVDGSPGEGFVAHELQEVVPGCVTGAKDAVQIVEVKGDDGQVLLDGEGLAVTKELPLYQGVDTSFLVAPVVAMLQEQQLQLQALLRRIAALEDPPIIVGEASENS